MPPGVTGSHSKDSGQGPPGHISLADHTHPCLSGGQRQGEVGARAFLAESQQGMQIFFFQLQLFIAHSHPALVPLTLQDFQPYLHL